MDRVKDIIWTGFKNTGVAMTFGAYHLYVMGEKWELRQTMYRLQDEKTKAMLEEMKGVAPGCPNRTLFKKKSG